MFLKLKYRRVSVQSDCPYSYARVNVLIDHNNMNANVALSSRVMRKTN